MRRLSSCCALRPLLRRMRNCPSARRSHKARADLRFGEGADDPSSRFPLREWSAGRRQGFARPLEAGLARAGPHVSTGGIASPAGKTRALRHRWGAKPAERTLRLPALHQQLLGSPGRRCSLIDAVCHEHAAIEEAGSEVTQSRTKVKISLSSEGCRKIPSWKSSLSSASRYFPSAQNPWR
jgi:hypothetical protein